MEQKKWTLSVQVEPIKTFAPWKWKLKLIACLILEAGWKN